MDTSKAERIALNVAVVVIVALTGAAFWLSYAHLADVAGEYGLGSSPMRRWAWPGTLDLFIVAGEILMFRAAVRRVRDHWAIGLTVIGSLGSIALNVAGVGTKAAVLDYVVAAVPPTAALLAFGALMRQVHTMVTAPATEEAPAIPEAPVATVPDTELDMDDAPADTKAYMAELLADLPANAFRQDTEPDNVVDMTSPVTRKAASRGRTDEEIQAAVDYLVATGQEVNGTNYAAHIGGISTRTGRRDLSRIGVVAA